MKSSLALFLTLSFYPTFALDISIDYSRFFTDESSYVEFNYYILGESISAPVDLIRKRSVQMTMIIKKDGNIVHADKFNAIGFNDNLSFSIIKRYGLSPGSYMCELQAVDNNDPANVFSWSEALSIETKKSGFCLSDVQLLSSIKKANEITDNSKNGFDIECLPFLFSRADQGQIYYYLESYNSTDLGKQYELKIDILEHYKNRPNELIKSITKKRKTKSVDILIGAIKIDDLPSGNYKVKMYVEKNDKAIYAVENNFQHSNVGLNDALTASSGPISEFLFLDDMSKMDLIYSLKSLVPRIISTDLEAVNDALQTQNVKKIKYLLKYHWTHFGGPDYFGDFKEYMAIAKAVDQKFDSGYGEGFETDRGYYYLKYGRPDNIIAENNDINAPPYEIWTYNSLPELQQANVKFVFYNPSLSPGNFELLHSTAKGEYNNPRWRVELTNAGPTKGKVNRLDGVDVEDGFGQNSGRYYDDN